MSKLSATRPFLAASAMVVALRYGAQAEPERLIRGTPTSEREYVVQHLTRVISGWLAYGPDPRRQFSRVGA